jgi:hypothetical protein
MPRTSLLLLAPLLFAGCYLPDREASLRPLPEGQSFTYQELLTRARNQATAALEAFYIDHWADLEEAASALEQTARFLPKTTAIPAGIKDKLGGETDELRKDAVKLGDSARARDPRATNDSLQRINLRIRELRVDEKKPAPVPPKTKSES